MFYLRSESEEKMIIVVFVVCVLIFFTFGFILGQIAEKEASKKLNGLKARRHDE
jgi:hypothetical protein